MSGRSAQFYVFPDSLYIGKVGPSLHAYFYVILFVGRCACSYSALVTIVTRRLRCVTFYIHSHKLERLVSRHSGRSGSFESGTKSVRSL